MCVRRVCIFSCCKHVSCQSWIYARRCCSDCDSLIKSKENSGGRSCVSFQAVSLWKCWMAAQMVLYFLYYYTLRSALLGARSLSLAPKHKTAPTFGSIRPLSSRKASAAPCHISCLKHTHQNAKKYDQNFKICSNCNSKI